MTPRIDFDEKAHAYKIDGRPARGVTSVIKAEGLMPPYLAAQSADDPDMAWSLDFGTKVHRAVELYEAGRLDEDDLDDLLRPRLEAWKAFKAESGWQAVAWEERLGHAALGFAGTADGRGFVPRYWPQPTMIDLKSGQPAPWHGVQLAGYNLCLAVPHKLLGVYLGPDGRFKQKEYSQREGEAVFMAALCLANWKEKNGI